MPSEREMAEQLYEAALDLKPEDRPAFLDRECNGNGGLRQEVEALLAVHARTGSFLGPPTEGFLDNATTLIIGPYHLLELIGEGGMGQVWLAEQKQPMRRRVAIKLIKAGMDTREVVARFESERQALALMDHPAIAKVFDAGSTPDAGRPYFVMEYVAGIPITDYCDRHKLTIRQRMELFIHVCEGVQHAHQKAIIHRDLKPSNILVAEVDGKPMPRIIDFGVAKAISQKLSAGTLYTRVGTLIGTLGYISPEQADPIREDIDTRTDVYSLGAVLYELLTGALPLDFKKLSYDEVLRCLRDQDPPRPSTKVTTIDSAIAAKNRDSDPSALVRELHGDPDAIALKALEKDRARRYASASELAADIGRYLRHEPVTAHPHSIAYRSRKYLRRHRLGLAVVAIAVLVALLLVTWWRIPPAVPVVESAVQLTDDGQPKSGGFVTDGSRICFTEGLPGERKIFQVSVTGGPVTPVQTGFADASIQQMTRDGSGLLITASQDPIQDLIFYHDKPLWWVPLPAGEPRLLGGLNVANADLLPDGRIVFAKFTERADPKATDSRTQYFIADKDGSNPRELVSFPGFPGGIGASPLGRRVIIVLGQPNGNSAFFEYRIFDIGVDGTGLREIRRLNAGEDGFNWTPDEKYLVYSSGNAGQSDIWLLPIQTGLFRRQGKPIRLTNGPLPYTSPVPSPNGKQIFILGTKRRGELVRYDMQSHEFTPFLSGISATDLTFSRDGKWVAYLSYPDRTLWRSRSDGTERKQLTFPQMHIFRPYISPDGRRVSFVTDKQELFVIGMEGGTPEKIDGNAFAGAWSPDGNDLYYQESARGVQVGGVIVDFRTGKRSLVPSSEGMPAEDMFGLWLTQDTLIAQHFEKGKFQTFDLKTQKWTDFAPGILGKDILDWMLSPDGKYLCYATGGAEPKVFRLRFADQRVETITSLKDLDRVVSAGEGPTELSVAPDGSPVFTRDTGYQEIYALNIRWP